MMRNNTKSERTETPASIVIKTMKTSRYATLLAAFTLTALGNTTARADGYFSTDTKHGTTQTRIHTASTRDNDEYSKFVWLCAGGNESSVTVDHIVVSLADQRLYAYHNGQLVAWSNISSGRPGHDTPTGSFTVSEKDVDHHSSLYDNAPMPYFMRLTDGGVGLHAGQLPGYPASHGCVRLPYAMARELYQHVESGTSVDIINTSVSSNVADLTAASPSVHLAQN
jgi:hypothetical protein